MDLGPDHIGSSHLDELGHVSVLPQLREWPPHAEQYIVHHARLMYTAVSCGSSSPLSASHLLCLHSTLALVPPPYSCVAWIEPIVTARVALPPGRADAYGTVTDTVQSGFGMVYCTDKAVVAGFKCRSHICTTPSICEVNVWHERENLMRCSIPNELKIQKVK
jgi:hypothetical protein